MATVESTLTNQGIRCKFLGRSYHTASYLRLNVSKALSAQWWRSEKLGIRRRSLDTLCCASRTDTHTGTSASATQRTQTSLLSCRRCVFIRPTFPNAPKLPGEQKASCTTGRYRLARGEYPKIYAPLLIDTERKPDLIETYLVS